jgi:hypothetical protein
MLIFAMDGKPRTKKRASSKSKGENFSLRFLSAELKDQYAQLAKESPFSMNGLLNVALEQALPLVQRKVKEFRSPHDVDKG